MSKIISFFLLSSWYLKKKFTILQICYLFPDQSSNVSEMFASGSASNVAENAPNEEESSDDELLFRPNRGGRGARA